MKRSVLIYIIGMAAILVIIVLVMGIAALATMHPASQLLHFNQKYKKTQLTSFSRISLISPDKEYDYWCYDANDITKCSWIEITGDRNISMPYILVPEDMCKYMNIRNVSDSLILSFDFGCNPATDVTIKSERPIEIHVPDSTLREVISMLYGIYAVNLCGVHTDKLKINALNRVGISESKISELSICNIQPEYYLSTYLSISASSIDKLITLPGDFPQTEYSLWFGDYPPAEVYAAYNADSPDNSVELHFTNNIPAKVSADEKVSMKVRFDTFDPFISYGSLAMNQVSSKDQISQQ